MLVVGFKIVERTEVEYQQNGHYLTVGEVRQDEGDEPCRRNLEEAFL